MIRTFSAVARILENYNDKILNFFVNRATNASAESFNVKIKTFREGFRGVTDILFSYSN
ncbi:MAG: transposase [Marinifilaceae bacterium]